jgi:amino acid adenylation domain-containing protein
MSERANQKLRLLDLLLTEEGIKAPARQPIPRRPNAAEFPLSSAQKRLWFLNHLEPGAHYNDHFNLRLKGPLHADVLQKCLTQIATRHEALRSRFFVERGEPIQRLSQPEPVAMPMTDLSELPETERMRQAVAIAVQEARTPFDLERESSFRARLLRLAPDDHLLVQTWHHIGTDGWSRGIFLRELTTVYPAFVAGNPSPLPPLPIQYADFAAWQQQWLQGAVSLNQLAYWKKQLAGAPALLEWPTDSPRPEAQSFRGARLPIQISKALTDALTELSRREGCTLFMTLLAAFQTLAARYTRQEDIVVGTPIANRNRAELEGLIGAFVNTLVLRANLSGNPTFRQVLARVREAALGAYANQDLPFERLVEELHPARNQSYNPIFQVMFVLQNTPVPTLKMADLSIQPLDIDSGVAKFDLTLNLEETAAGLSGWIEYSTDLFRHETVSRLVAHYQTLLKAVALNPNHEIVTLPLLTEVERAQLLVSWNDTRAEYPHKRCFHELFEDQAARTPDATAIVFRGQSLSYEQLNRRANRLAHHLRSLGVGPETLVGLCVERSLEMVIGLLAILKSGGAYLPLDPAFPSERLAFILQDAKVPVLITQESLLGNLPVQANQFRAVCIDAELSSFKGESEFDLRQLSSTEDLAYVLYTSGSTGKPKGVQIPHRALVNFLWSMASAPGFTAADVLVAVTTTSFDIAGLELWLPLMVGGTVVIADNETARSGKRLAEELERSGATMLQATPMTWRLLLESGWKGCPQLKALCGGEAWGADLAQALLPKCASLWNMYGPTETTIWSAATRVEKAETPFIGKPIANTQFYVLDARLQPVPLGVPGELHIGGDGVARGYLNRPELTAEKFVSDPFSSRPGARLYKTGDLARQLDSGKLEFLGRLDHQVKIRGFRVELGEIEAALLKHSNVSEAVVAARDGAAGDKRLVAYVVARQKPAPAPSELQSLVAGQLPGYMVPTAFVKMDALPLTPNGKIDRKALPEPEKSAAISANQIAPGTPMEKTIAKIWADVLRVEKVGLHDNFFDIGGHSLLLARVHAQLCEALQINLSIVKLFQHPTISSLAAHLAQPAPQPPSLAAAQRRAHLQRQAMGRREKTAKVTL